MELLDRLKEKYKDKWLFHIQDWSPSLHIFIMEKHGCALVKLTKEPYDDAVYISDLYVNKEYRGQHLGSELMDISEEIAHALNIDALELDAYKDQWAEKWYERLGFKSIDEEDEDDELKGIIFDVKSMRKELN